MNNNYSTSNTNPVDTLFITAIFTGILIVLSANSWLSIWMGLELNLFGFIPFIISGNSNQENEAACNYFLAQATPSAILLLCLILVPYLPTSSTFLAIALFINIGAAPCHQWFPSVMASLSWTNAWFLTTIQKLSPFFILTQLTSNLTALFSIVAILSSMIGGIGGINQTLLRPLIAYSSIGHIGWIIGAMLISNNTATLYLTAYILIVSTIILTANMINTNSAISATNINNNSTLILFIALSFLNMGGLPPFFGFFANASILNILISSNLSLLALFLIIGSIMNLYYYLNVVFINTLESPPQFVILTDSQANINTSEPHHPLSLPLLFIFSTSTATATLTIFI